MKLEIENKHLVRVINFLDGLNLKGMKSIYRTNLSRALQEKLKHVAENEKQLREELKGEQDKLKEELEVLFDEKTIIEGGDSQTMLQSVKQSVKEIIENEEKEFSNDNAYAIAALYEAFNLEGGDEE